MPTSSLIDSRRQFLNRTFSIIIDMKGQLVLPKGGFFGEPERKRKPIKSKIRKELLYARKKCQYCRRLSAQHLHHIRGVASGGSNRERNLARLCAYCHQRVTSGEITTNQLKRRLGIKVIKKPKKIHKKRREYSNIFGRW
jgi:hypothetical protein